MTRALSLEKERLRHQRRRELERNQKNQALSEIIGPECDWPAERQRLFPELHGNTNFVVQAWLNLQHIRVELDGPKGEMPPILNPRV
jgi:hypothetical protein